MKPITILFLTANPSDTTRIRTNFERLEVQDEISKCRDREAIRLVYEPDVSPRILIDAFQRYRPEIVHFSGHGSANHEVVLASDDGASRLLQKDDLAELFRLQGESVQVVLLNACYSEKQAASLLRFVPCAIGMSTAIEDEAAINFSRTFYRSIAEGESVRRAFETGLLQLKLTELSEAAPTHRDLNPDLAPTGSTAPSPPPMATLLERAQGVAEHLILLDPSPATVTNGKTDPIAEPGRPDPRAMRPAPRDPVTVANDRPGPVPPSWFDRPSPARGLVGAAVLLVGLGLGYLGIKAAMRPPPSPPDPALSNGGRAPAPVVGPDGPGDSSPPFTTEQMTTPSLTRPEPDPLWPFGSEADQQSVTIQNRTNQKLRLWFYPHWKPTGVDDLGQPKWPPYRAIDLIGETTEAKRFPIGWVDLRIECLDNDHHDVRAPSAAGSIPLGWKEFKRSEQELIFIIEGDYGSGSEPPRTPRATRFKVSN